MTDRPLRIALLGHSSRSDNLGVGALTVSQIEILREVAAGLGRALEVTILEWRDPRTPYVTGDDIRLVSLDGRAMLDPRRYMAEIRRSDLVIDIGAGDSFTDIYSGKRLRWMFVQKFAAHALRRPLVMAPQTIGPFSKPASTRLARTTMRLCALVASRDALSTGAARAMGISRNLVEASDVALRLPYDPPGPRGDGPLRIGLNVSGLLMNGGYTGRNEFGLTLDYPALVREIIAWAQGEGAELHLVAHVLSHDPAAAAQREDDHAACARLCEEHPGCVLAPAFESPSEAKTYIAGLDFFMGARMHACIAAFSSGVPVVPMAYSRKFEGLFGTLGYERTVDCTDGSPEEIMRAIRTAFEERETVAAQTREALARGLDRLGAYERALADVIERL